MAFLDQCSRSQGRRESFARLLVGSLFLLVLSACGSSGDGAVAGTRVAEPSIAPSPAAGSVISLAPSTDPLVGWPDLRVDAQTDSVTMALSDPHWIGDTAGVFSCLVNSTDRIDTRADRPAGSEVDLGHDVLITPPDPYGVLRISSTTSDLAAGLPIACTVSSTDHGTWSFSMVVHRDPNAEKRCIGLEDEADCLESLMIPKHELIGRDLMGLGLSGWTETNVVALSSGWVPEEPN